ncbi:MAG TPA: T9SS type A sorting domain-containing protein [Ignavibacteria bacterium]|jgi:hypothetical protein
MKKSSILFLSLAVIQFFVAISLRSQDGPNAWTLNLNNNGRVYVISVCASNQNIVYSAGLDSGVYKSIDGGFSWTQVNTGMTYFKVQALAVAPSNSNIVYAGTDQNGSSNSGVYVTTNGGASWTLMNTGITDTKAIQWIAVHPTNPSIAYITVFDGINPAIAGIYKTTDGGNSWAPANSGITNMNILSIAINPLNPNVLYAGSSLILPGSTGPSKMFRTNNAGASWVEISNGLPTGTTTGDPVRSISISTLDTAVVLAGLFLNDTAGGAYVTTNGGQLWTKKHTGLPNVAGTLLRIVLIKPGTTNQFFVGLDGGGATSRGVWRTTDGGNSWTEFNSAPMSNTYTVRGLAYRIVCDTTLLCGAATATVPGRGVFDYTWPYNPGSCTISWVLQASGTTAQLNTVKSVSNLIGWAAGNTAVVRKTIDGGASWTNANPNPGVITGDIYAIDALDANTAWLTTSPGATFIYRTTNGGTNWTQVFTQPGGFIDGLQFVNASTGFAYGDPVAARWSLWKTTNGGVNWDSTGLYLAQVGSEAGWNNALEIMGTNIWFGTSNTKVYHSTNFGATWTSGPTTGQVNSYSLAFNSLSLGLAGGTILQRTTDGGANYTTITALGTGNVTGIAGAGPRFWYTRGTSIYYSSNSGDNWSSAYTGAGNLLDLDVSTPNCCAVGWAVGATGTIVGLGIVAVGNNNNQIPDEYMLMQNYPNPFNPSTVISFQLPKAGNVKLVVYDLLGREVKTLVNEFKSQGTYEVEFNAADYASGVYFYRLESGTFTDTKKMLLVK